MTILLPGSLVTLPMRIRCPNHVKVSEKSLFRVFSIGQSEPRLAITRDNGDIAIWDLAKIDRQLTELGLGFALAPAEFQPTQDKP